MTQTFKIKGVLGNVAVRGGSYLMVKLYIGDETLNDVMMVESVTHTFTNDIHTMDLTLTGRGFTSE